MKPYIVVCGQGNMARALQEECRRQDLGSDRFTPQWLREVPEVEKADKVAVHFGSGRHLGDLLTYCERTNTPLIQGSTNVEVPKESKVVLINAPNLSLPMVRFLAAFPEFAKALRPGMEIRVVESHQGRNADTSGTARAMTKALDLDATSIKMIRDRDVQRTYGVPEEHLDGHAYHSFMFVGQGVTIEVTTKIHGRQTYAEGAVLLARALLENAQMEPEVGIHRLPLMPGVHELADAGTQCVFGLIRN